MAAVDTPDRSAEADAQATLNIGEMLLEDTPSRAAVLEVRMGFHTALRIRSSPQAAGNAGLVFHDLALTPLGLHLLTLPKEGSKFAETSILGEIDLENAFCHWVEIFAPVTPTVD